MNVLLIEDEDILRHAIIMSVGQVFGDAEITAYASFNDLWEHEADLSRFSLALIDPGVPPIPTGANRQRLEALSKLILAADNACRIIVFTGSFNTNEAELMFAMGVEKYLSKTGINILELRKAINDKSVKIVPPNTTGQSGEHFVSGLTPAESMGYAVSQRIYNLDSVADALGLDIDTVKKYVARGRSRARSR